MVDCGVSTLKILYDATLKALVGVNDDNKLAFKALAAGEGIFGGDGSHLERFNPFPTFALDSGPVEGTVLVHDLDVVTPTSTSGGFVFFQLLYPFNPIPVPPFALPGVLEWVAYSTWYAETLTVFPSGVGGAVQMLQLGLVDGASATHWKTETLIAIDSTYQASGAALSRGVRLPLQGYHAMNQDAVTPMSLLVTVALQDTIDPRPVFTMAPKITTIIQPMNV